MVYGALFSATLQGTFEGGAAWMFGFGAGTLPAIIASALGIRALARLNKGTLVRSAVGLTIAAIGFTTVYIDWPKVLCLT
jgi:sulfite exporter TauE/SafE